MATPTPASSKPSPGPSAQNFSQSFSPSPDVSKRSSSSGGPSGAISSARHIPHARNNQPLRKQHKASRRAKLADEDAFVESANMRPFNSRKGQTSITHLMNFSLPPRPHQQSHSFHPRHHQRPRTWGLGSGYHIMDKARYVHANYRFIVRPDREYHIQTVDADVHLSWDNVLQVLGSAETQSTNCPICLSTPVAPRMARCGHIFCLPCLIRYMHSTDDSNPVPEKRARWKKCPICEDSVYISETRPVRWSVDKEASQLMEGGDVCLKLLKREPGSTLALPRDAAEKYGQQTDIPWYHVAEIMDYARFMKGGEQYMIEQYDQEITELDAQEKEDELMFGDDNTWTRRAIASIEDAKLKLAGIGGPTSTTGSLKHDSDANDPIAESWQDEAEASEPRVASSSDLSSTMAQLPLSQPAPESIPEQTKHPTKAGRQAPFYFYSALPNFYLSPLDIRILKAAYGDFAAFPSTILPRVEHISTGHVIDDDLRKRAKYIGHLPYGCEVSFLECDWTDLITPVVLEQFKDDIIRRRKRNHDKEAREERDRLRAEREEDARLSSIRRRRPSVPEKSFSETDFQPLVNHDISSSSPGGSAGGLAATPPWGNHRTHSSFATLATPGTSPDAPRTVWGTTAVTPSSPTLVASPEPSRQVDDGWLQGWEKDILDEGDAVAMVQASIDSESVAKQANGAAGAAPGKKSKKPKKITLMSTGNARRGA
ncbi:uncharacterized protein HMPREF1541_00580 [Cyphellophora europaea CBS 101466]|uniref:RING-type domain-containing protein n=1 Tax=Cyphellophora europaea (strain CBS 101466) TaxID=1220924 RepID=W2SCG7_CYPE1|nr:uncharacterized protein HMPREF1541_00580 [Cyphellophora europaea CBS 101466]ETN46396.1 hypothetical protein HMPREF1541_00580 [Cyphellophora europaea CBS 101466]